MTVRVGATYPQTELRGDPTAGRAFALAAEDLGYDHLLAYDHVVGAVHADREPELWGPYTEADPFHDPFVLFAHLAALTERLSFVTGVLILPQRQTALVAKQAADLALLAGPGPEAGGRFRLGVGVGWNHVEYDVLDQDFATRGHRLDEQIEVLRRLWAEPVVTFDGDFHRLDRVATIPRPANCIPIWIGGWADVALRRAARLGDGFIFAGTEAAISDQWDRLRSLLAEHGRSVSTFGAEAMVTGHQDPVDAAAAARRWEQRGGTHAAITSMGLGLDSVDAHIDYLARAARALALPGAG